MSETSAPGPLPGTGHERVPRGRPKSGQTSLRERLDQPLARASKVLAWFPIRVWRHFLQHNGFLLAAGISYQALFAIFGVIYLAFAVVGVWLGGSEPAIRALIRLINGYIPGIIADSGLVKPDQVVAVAEGSARLLTVTGVVAAVVVIWTAIGFVTYTRRAVRDTFGLPFDRRSYLLLKARDLLAAVLFGLSLLVGAGLGSITTGAVDLLFSLFGWDIESAGYRLLARVVSVIVAFALNAVALASLFRFLTGTSLTWRRIWPGAVLGAAAMVVLQVGAGFLFVYTPANPLLATFTVFIGFLLWFRLNGIVILVSAAWIAVAAADDDETLQSEPDREAMELGALYIAARVRLREARARHRDAPWFARRRHARAVRSAERELDRAREAATGQRREPGLLD